MPKGHFIITDISGYTEFLTHSELEHAHDILQSLFKAQLDYIKPPFVISGFQGDAILSYIPESSYYQPQSIFEALENLYCSFWSTLEQMQFHTTCTCRACKGIPLLDLKMVVHYGDYILQQMGNREELLGTDVIIPHRMLKNQVVKQTGIKSYALFSEAAKNALGLDNICETLHDHIESYEHIGDVNMVVYDLSTAWEREKAKRRKVIPPEEAWVGFDVEIAAPPSLVWDYLTLPNLKVQLMGLETVARTDKLGGRVREDSAFHCAHGELKYDYKIIDWKPFEYFTDLATDSITGLQYIETNFFIPSESGTRFVNSVEKPAGEIPEDAQATLQGIWDMAYGGLKSFIEDEIRDGKVVVPASSN